MANLGLRTNPAGDGGAITLGGTDVVTIDATGITQGTGRRLAQIVEYETGALLTGTNQIAYDDTIPQSNEGDQYLSVSITPQNAGSTLEVSCNIYASPGNPAWVIAALFKDADANAIRVMPAYVETGTAGVPIPLEFRQVAGTISPITFKVRVGTNLATTVTLNGGGGTRRFGGMLKSSISVKEYLP